jgi:hypothetical protein
LAVRSHNAQQHGESPGYLADAWSFFSFSMASSMVPTM